MCAYTRKAGWKVGQASHRAYYGNKAAFHFLGKTTAAASKEPGTEYDMSVHLMTVEIERKIHRNCITWLLCSWEVFYYSHWFYSGVETVLSTVSSVIVKEGVIWWHVLDINIFGLLIYCLVCRMSENSKKCPQNDLLDFFSPPVSAYKQSKIPKDFFF